MPPFPLFASVNRFTPHHQFPFYLQEETHFESVYYMRITQWWTVLGQVSWEGIFPRGLQLAVPAEKRGRIEFNSRNPLIAVRLRTKGDITP